jgi:hypothetical protein
MIPQMVLKNSTSKAQDLVNEVIYWSDENKMQLNAEKCKELRTSFNVNPIDMHGSLSCKWQKFGRRRKY